MVCLSASRGEDNDCVRHICIRRPHREAAWLWRDAARRPRCVGPPKDYDAALAVLREAVACGVNHIDTSDFYGPHVTNQIIREALHPYPKDLVIVTKVRRFRQN